MSSLTSMIRAVATTSLLTIAGATWAGQKPVLGNPGAGSSGQTGSGPTGSGQTGSRQTGGIAPAASGTDSPLDGISSPFPDTGKQKRNDERQRRIVTDTQKLVALTAQLKAEVAASGVDTMTPEMLKQMDEIEKLAKSVKDRMRN